MTLCQGHSCHVYSIDGMAQTQILSQQSKLELSIGVCACVCVCACAEGSSCYTGQQLAAGDKTKPACLLSLSMLPGH